MHVRIEPGRIRAFKFLEEGFFVAVVADVITNVIGVGQREDDQIMTFAVAERA